MNHTTTNSNLYNIFAIADIHLPAPYSARRFKLPSSYWQMVKNHLWENPPEVLLLAGDLFWASTPNNIQEHLQELQSLPGEYKIFVEGNHDPWFDQLGDTYEEAQKHAYELFSDNDFYYVGGRSLIIPLENGENIGICGARGFAKSLNSKPDLDQQIQKLNQLESMERSLKHLKKLLDHTQTISNICLMHYGPSARIFDDNRKGDEDFYHLIVNSGIIQKIVFGHIHVDPHLRIFTATKRLQMYCAAIDRIGFKAMRILIP